MAVASVLAAGIVLFAGPEAVSGAGGDTITQPPTVELAPGGFTTLDPQTLHLDAAPPKADILLAFDTTSSMSQGIVDARTDAAQIVNSIKASIPGVRFALADFRDYPFAPFGGVFEPPNDDYPWRVDQDFTGTLSEITSALDNIGACTSCGSDLPEAYNRAFYEAYHDGALSWAAATPRFMVVLGDSYGHDPNQGIDFGPGGGGDPNCPSTPQIDPGPDATLGTSDDLGTLPTLTTLKSTYHTNVSFVTYNPTEFGPPNKVACQTALAQFTGGSEVVHGPDSPALGNQIIGLINAAAARVDQVTFDVEKVSGPSIGESNWFTFEPSTLGPATAPVDIQFTEHIDVPDGQALGTYVFAVHANADGALRATQTVTVRVVGDAVSDVHLSVDESALPAGVAVAPFSSIPASRIPFFTGATTSSTPYGSTPYGSTPFGSTPFGSTPFGSTPWGSTPFGSTPYGSTPYGSTPFGSTPWGSTPFGSTPFGSTGVLGQTPFGSTPFGSTPFDHVLLSQLPLLNPASGASWPLVLAGTPFAGLPLSATSLADVLGNSTTRDRLYALPMKDISFASTLWQGVPVGAILLGQSTVGQIPVPQSVRNETGQTTWQGVINAAGGCATCVSSSNTFFGIAIAGALGDAHIGAIPFGSTPYGSTPGGQITLNSMNIAGTRLAAVQLSAITPLSDIVDCTAFACAGKTLGDAAAARAIKQSATLAKLFDDLPAANPARQMTLDEIVGSVLPFTAYPWEELPVQGLQDVAGTGKNAHYHVDFTLACGSTSSFRVEVRLPLGFIPVHGSSKLIFGGQSVAIPDASLTTSFGGEGEKPETRAVWTSPNGVCTGAAGGARAIRLDFAAFTGLTLGDQASRALVTAAGVTHTASEQAPVLVTQNHEANDDPATAPTISDNQLIVGHVASAGDKEYFRFPLSGVPVNSRLVAFLKVPGGADLDLTINGPSLAPVQSTPFGSTNLGGVPVPDQPISTDNSDTTPQANTLSDIPFGSTPFGSTPFGSTASGSVSQNRESASEQAAIVIHQSSSGMATLGVTGYQGSHSDQPYVLRLEVLPPPPLPPCPARTGYGDATQIGPLPAPSSLPAATKTLFLVDRQRLARLYTSATASTIVAPASAGGAVGANLAALAARPEVQGAVLSVDGNAAVRTAYATWDANTCSPDAANGVVRSINSLVATYRAALPNLKYIVLLGTDTAVPMYRQPDPTILSPELDEAADLAFTTANLTRGNSLYAASAQNMVLTDGAYGAFTRIPWLDHELPLPQISISRLVETPGDINGQLAEYLSVNGTLQPGTLSPQHALTTGYDFLADGAAATNAALGDTTRFPGITTDSLISQIGALPATLWTKTDVDTKFFNNASVPELGALYGHYNHFAFKPAGPENVTDVATQVVTTNAAAVGKNYGRHVIFSVGCHGGLNAGDELGRAGAAADIAAQYQDWAQTLQQDKIAAFVGNTGFGYGDTDTIAASEKLFKLFAENMNKGSSVLGDNWLNALTDYFVSASVYSAYDEKVMLEATYYGLPFWRFGSAPVAVGGSGMTTSSSNGIDIGSASLPTLGTMLTAKTGVNGTKHWEGPAGTLAVPYRPIQPLATKDVTVPGKQARDVFLTSLTTHDVANPNPTKAYPVANDSSNEPSANFRNSYWPASFATVLRAPRFGAGERDTVAINAGQFRPGTNTERLVDSVGFDVTYSTLADTTRPLISQVGAIQDPGATTAKVFIKASDASPIRKVAVLWNDGRNQWGYFDQFVLQNGLYVGTLTGVTGHVELGAEVMDVAGNVGQSWDKAFNFQAITDTGGPDIVVENPLPTNVYTLNQVVKPNFTCSDDGGVASCSGAILVNGNLDTSTVGDHVFTVTATDLAGNTVTRTVAYSVRYGFVGFKQPVDNPPVLNVAKAGSTIPVKWTLQDSAGKPVSQLSAVTAIAVQTIPCPAAPTDAIETTVAPGLSGLTYDTAGKQFIFNWQTLSTWTGCRRLTVEFADGTSRYADFQFK